MSQTWNLPLAAGSIISDWRLALNDAGEAVRTLFAGPTAPTSPSALMFWADTTENWIKQRDLANGAWTYRWPILANGAMLNVAPAWLSSSAATLVPIPALHILPSSSALLGAEIELVPVEGREQRLKSALEEISGDFAYILIDCPPSLGLLTLNALVAAHSVLIPLQCEYYALEGLTHLLTTLRLIRRSFNPGLEIEGVVFTMYDSRLNLNRQVVEDVRRNFSGRVFETLIPRSTRLSEAPSFGKPIILYDIRSAGAEAYLHLAKEVIDGTTGARSGP